jgi:hypothetical protein
MEMTKVDVSSDNNDLTVLELGELELALVGGGTGDISLG